MWAMRSNVIKEHHDALVDFFEDHIRARRWLLDPKNHDEAIAITSDFTKIPADKLAFAFTKEDFYRSPDARPDVASVQKEIDESVQLSVLPKSVTLVPNYVDLSLIEEAKKRIDGK